MIASHSSGDMFTSIRSRRIPALFTSTCRSPKVSTAWRIMCSAPSKSDTSSTSGLFGNVGQTNYGSAKTGIATFSIILDKELERYGVRVNAIAPAAATRLTAQVNPEFAETPSDEWTPMHPGNISPFVAYLATEDCPIHGRVFLVQGSEVALFQPFVIVDRIAKEGDFWTVEELAAQAPRLQEFRFDYGHSFGSRAS